MKKPAMALGVPTTAGQYSPGLVVGGLVFVYGSGPSKLTLADWLALASRNKQGKCLPT